MVFRKFVWASIGGFCFASLTANSAPAASSSGGDKCKTRATESNPQLCQSNQGKPQPTTPSKADVSGVDDETKKAFCDTLQKCQAQCGGQDQSKGQGQGRGTASSPNGGTGGGECGTLEKQLKELDDQLSKPETTASN